MFKIPQLLILKKFKKQNKKFLNRQKKTKKKIFLNVKWTRTKKKVKHYTSPLNPKSVARSIQCMSKDRQENQKLYISARQAWMTGAAAQQLKNKEKVSGPA